MNMNTDAELMKREATRVAPPTDNLLEQAAAEAREHNARRFMQVQQAQEGMRVAAEVYGELSRTPLYRLALGGTYLFFWGLAALLLVLAFGNLTT
jgi:hypothetical protein